MIEVVIIDYSTCGNIKSVISALEYLGVRIKISSKPEDIYKANFLVLPGVGSFKLAYQDIESQGLNEAIRESVLYKGTKILGICLGMQLMASESTEGGHSLGLNLINNKVEHISTMVENIKIPNVGFKRTTPNSYTRLFKGLPQNPYFYFTHSYCIKLQMDLPIFCESDIGFKFISGFQKENIFGTQFHPEKSQSNGLVILKNFITA